MGEQIKNTHQAKGLTVDLDLGWFMDNIDAYLKEDRFQLKEFSEILGFDYRDIREADKKEEIARIIVSSSSIFFEINRDKGGAIFPEKVYRRNVNWFNQAPRQVPKVDELVLKRPMCFSLNHRFKTLNRVILPYVFDELLSEKDKLTCANIGSGLGTDLHQTAKAYHEKIDRIINIDTDETAISLGKKEIPAEIAGKVNYYNQSLTKQKPAGENSYDLCLMIGVICPLTDSAAIAILKQIRDDVSPGGIMVVSSSTYKMHDHDPLCNINIQITAQWALNCRTESQLYNVIDVAGFDVLEITAEPTMYNWIAIAQKPLL